MTFMVTSQSLDWYGSVLIRRREDVLLVQRFWQLLPR